MAELRTCCRCVQPFSIDPVIEAKLRAQGPGHYQKNCGLCVVEELIEAGFSRDQVLSDLRAAGVDVEAFARGAGGLPC